LHYVEKLGADPCAIVALGFLGAADVDRALVKRRDPGEAPLLRAVIAAYTMLNMVVVRPMPSVRARMATNVRARLFRSDRPAYRMSLKTACMTLGV
jgi:hypothetical protein